MSTTSAERVDDGDQGRAGDCLRGVDPRVASNVTLSIVVMLFGLYALLDGVWTIGAGTRASTHVFDAWPVLLEGVVSVALGLLALAWPWVPRRFVYVLAAWGLITGVLELVAALRLPREGAGHWLLGTAGVSSLFLAILILRALARSTGESLSSLVTRGLEDWLHRVRPGRGGGG
jgi:hypothetical protein